MRIVTVLAASIGIVACGAGATSPGTPPVEAGGDASDAGAQGSVADSSAAASSNAMDASRVDAAASDASSPSDAKSEASAKCAPFGNATQMCSDSCYGNCYGLNANNNPDPSVHLSDCTFTSVAGTPYYCAPYGASDPCSYCP